MAIIAKLRQSGGGIKLEDSSQYVYSGKTAIKPPKLELTEKQKYQYFSEISSRRIRILPVLYAIFQIAQGLLIHPFQTMQSLVKEYVFLWLVLLPSVFLSIFTLVWRSILLPTAQQVYTCGLGWSGWCAMASFLAIWLIFFCVWWQLLLLYLLYRFRQALGTNRP